MKKLKNLIYGVFIRVKGVPKIISTDIDFIIKDLIKDSTLENDIIDRIEHVLSVFKFSKFDIYDFKKTVDKLSKTILQEKLLYSSILTTLSDTGVTKEDIIKSIFYYVGVLSNFSKKGKEHAEMLIKSSGDCSETKITELLKQKEDNKQLIEKLLHQNNDIDVNILNIKNTTQKYNSDINKVKNSVDKISTNYINSLKLEKDKCIDHLS